MHTPAIKSVRELEPAVKEVTKDEQEAAASLEERTERATSEVFEEEAGTPGKVVTPVLPLTGAVQVVPTRRLVARGEEEGEERAVNYTAVNTDVTGGGRSGAEFSVYENTRRQEERVQQNSYMVEQTPRTVAPVLNPTLNTSNPTAERAARTPLFHNPDLEQFEGQRSKYHYHRPGPETEPSMKRKPWQR